MHILLLPSLPQRDVERGAAANLTLGHHWEGFVQKQAALILNSTTTEQVQTSRLRDFFVEIIVG